MSKIFRVNFFENNSRRFLQGNSLFLNNATSDFAVQAWLKKQYPNSEIIINSIEWR